MLNFNRFDFFPKKKDLSINEIIKILKSNVLEKKIHNDNYLIEDISSPNIVRSNSILFYDSKSINDPKDYSNISLIITDNFNFFHDHISTNILLVNSIDSAYSCIINLLLYHDDSLDFNDEFINIEGSLVSKFAKIHPTTKILGNSVIGRGVSIGKNCIIKRNTVITNSIIGDNVVICDNSTIGSSGFGFNLKNLGSKNILPQIGIVYIDSNVHIGSNCSVDRAKIDFTFIGKNSSIDNMVHIAHNVKIQENACIAAQTGISGSTTIGKNLICGGQVGFAGHLNIGDNVVVAAKSGVTKAIKSNSTIAGFPAIDIKEWKKQIINQKNNGHK